MSARMSDAAGTSWRTPASATGPDELLRAARHGPRPDAEPGGGLRVSGYLREALATRWGLPKGVVVAGGGGDNAASGVGVGVVRAGEAFVSGHQRGAVYRDGYQPDPDTAVHTFCT